MDRADQIRRKIALYRKYLAEGVDGDRAATYLREIKRLEGELAQRESGDDKRQ